MGNTQTIYDDGIYIRPTKINNPYRQTLSKKYNENNSTLSRSKSLINNKNKNKSEQSLQKVFGIDDQSLLRSYWQHQVQQGQRQNISQSFISKNKLSRSNSKSIIHQYKIRGTNKENQEDKVSQILVSNHRQKQSWRKIEKKKQSIINQKLNQQEKNRKMLSPVNQNILQKQRNASQYQEEQSESLSVLPNFSKNNQSSLNRCRQRSQQFSKKLNNKAEQDQVSLKSYQFNDINNYSISQSNAIELLKGNQIGKTSIGKQEAMFDGETFQYQNYQVGESSRKLDQSKKIQQKASALNLQSSVVNIFNIVQQQTNEKQCNVYKNKSMSKDQEKYFEESQSQINVKQSQLKTIISKLDQIYQITKNRQQQELNQFVLNNQIAQNSEVGTIKRQVLTPRSIIIDEYQIKKNKQAEILDPLKCQAKNISIWKLQQLQLEREEMYKEEYKEKINTEFRKSNKKKQKQENDLNKQLRVIMQNSKSSKQLKSPSNIAQKQCIQIKSNCKKSPMNKVNLISNKNNISISSSQAKENQIYSVRSNIQCQNQHFQNAKSEYDPRQRKFFKAKKDNNQRQKKKCPTEYLKRIKQLQNELSMRRTQDQMQKYESRKCSPVKKQLTTPRYSQISQNSVQQSDRTIIEATHSLISKHRNKYFKLK